MLLLWIFIFVISLLFLIKGADYFTSAAEKLGLFFGMSHFVVGVTIVAFGTSLPELASSIVAVILGNSEIVVGNVIGSNIANILFVLGIVGVVAGKIKVKRKHLKKDLMMLSISAIALGITISDGIFSLFEGVIFILALIVYIIFNLSEKVKHKKEKVILSKWVIPSLIVGGVAICYGAKYTIFSLLKIATVINVPASILSVSAVALGTSLPEVVVSIIAVKKKNAGMAIGNILGSNVFNTFSVMGIPALFGALTIPTRIISFVLPVMLFATILFVLVCYDKKIVKTESIILLIIYGIFLFALF